ncbi:MAG: hypothetical protein VXY77_00815 [Pseudomonadota bacterium]|nr:hypothetical protein [Pseudomonadota bacterium]
MQEVIKDLYHGLEKHTGKRSAQFILHPLKDPLSWKTFKGAIESIPEYRRSPVLALTLLGFFSSNQPPYLKNLLDWIHKKLASQEAYILLNLALWTFIPRVHDHVHYDQIYQQQTKIYGPDSIPCMEYESFNDFQKQKRDIATKALNKFKQSYSRMTRSRAQASTNLLAHDETNIIKQMASLTQIALKHYCLGIQEAMSCIFSYKLDDSTTFHRLAFLSGLLSFYDFAKYVKISFRLMPLMWMNASTRDLYQNKRFIFNENDPDLIKTLHIMPLLNHPMLKIKNFPYLTQLMTQSEPIREQVDEIFEERYADAILCYFKHLEPAHLIPYKARLSNFTYTKPVDSLHTSTHSNSSESKTTHKTRYPYDQDIVLEFTHKLPVDTDDDKLYLDRHILNCFKNIGCTEYEIDKDECVVYFKSQAVISKLSTTLTFHDMITDCCREATNKINALAHRCMSKSQCLPRLTIYEHMDAGSTVMSHLSLFDCLKLNEVCRHGAVNLVG